MYLEYFGLKEPPFSIAPNPRYLFMSHQHQEALAHLIYGLRGEGGVILLTGEVGTGKTTISRKLLEELPDKINIAWIVNPKLSVTELLATICDEFSIAYSAGETSIKVFTDLLSSYLIEAHGDGFDTVLMIDEAQNLSPEVLEQLRLLTNLETSERKLLQIVLLGQPELKAMLERNDLRQLAQRITARYHLGSLNPQECSSYLSHRLAVAGCDRSIISNKAAALIHRHSLGIPRLINLICDRALLGAFAEAKHSVSATHVEKAANEVLGKNHRTSPSGLTLKSTLIAATLLFIFTLAFNLWPSNLLEQGSVTSHVNNTPKAAAQSEHLSPVANIDPDDELTEPSSTTEGTTASAPIFDNDPWVAIEKYGEKPVAYETLAQLWGAAVILDEKSGNCSGIQQERLQCKQLKNGTWILERINRPALFRYITDSGLERFAVVRSINKAFATIQLNQQQWRISRSELDAKWANDFTFIWRTPPGFIDSLRPGDRGEAINWLAKQLDRIQGSLIPPATSTQMDRLMVERVKQLQKEEGLHPDGIAGVQTLIRINDRIGTSAPRLNGEERS